MLYGHKVCCHCYRSFATRRRAAYVIDILLILWSLDTVMFILAGHMSINSHRDYLMILFLAISIIIFFPLIKDGFGGYSPGKALLGLKVINDLDGEPIGFWRSFKRNFSWSNWTVIRVCFELGQGYRTGDERAQSKVIWTRYAEHPVFLPVCKGGLQRIKDDYQPDKNEKRAEKALKKAVKTETKGKWKEAITQYNNIISDYPDTQIAKDASIALEALMEHISTLTQESGETCQSTS